MHRSPIGSFFLATPADEVVAGSLAGASVAVAAGKKVAVTCPGVTNAALPYCSFVTHRQTCPSSNPGGARLRRATTLGTIRSRLASGSLLPCFPALSLRRAVACARDVETSDHDATPPRCVKQTVAECQLAGQRAEFLQLVNVASEMPKLQFQALRDVTNAGKTLIKLAHARHSTAQVFPIVHHRETR